MWCRTSSDSRDTRRLLRSQDPTPHTAPRCDRRLRSNTLPPAISWAVLLRGVGRRSCPKALILSQFCSLAQRQQTFQYAPSAAPGAVLNQLTPARGCASSKSRCRAQDCRRTGSVLPTLLGHYPRTIPIECSLAALL